MSIHANLKQATIMILTDLEPDDVMALAILPKANYYVVGEGNSHLKYLRMLTYVKLLGHSKAIVIEGEGSDKKFPTEGEEFSNLDPDVSCQTSFGAEFLKFANSSNPIMICLKPPRELSRLFNENPVKWKLELSKITLYMYGGFNLRSIFNRTSSFLIALRKQNKELKEAIEEKFTTVPQSLNLALKQTADELDSACQKECEQKKRNLEILLSMFKRVYLYESFFVSGKNNSMNRSNFPKLYEYLMVNRNHPYLNALLKLTVNWNQSIVKDCQQETNQLNLSVDQLIEEISNLDQEDKIKELKDRIAKIEDEIEVNQRIVNNIQGNQEFQYVIADMGLAAVFRDIQPKPIHNLKFTNYTTFDFLDQPADSIDDDHQMFIYTDIPNKILEQHILKYFKLRFD